MSGLPSWFVVYQIGILVAVVCGIIFYLYHTRIRLIWKVRFYRQGEGGQYVFVGSKEFKPKDEYVSFGKGLDRKEFKLDIGKIGERDSNKTILFYDLDNEKTLQFVQGVRVGDGIANEIILAGKFAKQWVAGAIGFNPYVIAIILAMVAVAILCFFLGNLMPDLFVTSSPVNGGSDVVEVLLNV